MTNDFLGRKMRVTYPADPKSGERAVATTHFNAMGVTSVAMYYKGVNTGIVQSATYNEFGRRLSVTHGNGVITTYDYDARQRLTDIISATNANNQATSLLDLHYTLNTRDSITAVDNTPDMGPENIARSTMRFNYRYDGLNRLVHATGSYERDNTSELPKKFEQAFAYAQNGNLSRKETLDPDSHSVNDRWTYTYTNHAVTGIDATLQAGRFIMEYDANGNMTRHADNTESRSKRMTYDSTNRIRTVKDEGTGDTVGTYYYDDGGFRVRRISKREVGGKKYEHEILYTSMYMGLEIQKDTQGNVVTNSYAAVNNIYLNGLRIATIIPSGEVTYYLTDQVDSVKVVVNEQGLPVSRTEFHPYGDTWFQEGNDNFAPKYNSQELDKESGLYFYNARYYDAEVGRFVTADNVIDGEYDTQGWNRYSYVKNNPIIFKDPTGHQSRDFMYSTGDIKGDDDNSYNIKIAENAVVNVDVQRARNNVGRIVTGQKGGGLYQISIVTYVNGKQKSDTVKTYRMNETKTENIQFDDLAYKQVLKEKYKTEPKNKIEEYVIKGINTYNKMGNGQNNPTAGTKLVLGERKKNYENFVISQDYNEGLTEFRKKVLENKPTILLKKGEVVDGTKYDDGITVIHHRKSGTEEIIYNPSILMEDK